MPASEPGRGAENPADIVASIAANSASEGRLLERVQEWADGGGEPGRPSRLPGWTVGHVLTHLARNADGLRNLVEGSARGEVRSQYPSVDIRNADIETGAVRPAAALVDDVRTSTEALRASWSSAVWSAVGDTLAGTVAIHELPVRRRREVEVHHVDLGLGYEAADWPADFVRSELRRRDMIAKSRLPMGMTSWPAEVLALPDAIRLAWLLGRHRAEGLPAPPPWT